MFTQEGEEEFKDLTEEDDDGDDDDEEERFVDADKLEEGANAETEEAETKEAKPAASWVHHQNLEGLWADQIYDQYLAFLCVTVTIT